MFLASKNDFAYFKTGLFKWLYEKFRYPFAPMYGGFPVKLRTFLGDPIPYDPKVTAEELAEKVICVFFLSIRADSVLNYLKFYCLCIIYEKLSNSDFAPLETFGLVTFLMTLVWIGVLHTISV